jgi:NADH-quinone oxidoreductase subunit J
MNPNTLFLLLSFFLIFSALMVVLSRHPVFSLLFLVGCFLFSSFLLFLLESEFLAFLFLIIYVGAIAVLFLFAVMMLESKSINLSRNVIKYVPIGGIFVIFLLIPLLNEISVNFNHNIFINSFYVNKYQNWYDLADSITDVEIYGQVLYSYFVLHFLIAGFILLLVLICVVYLTNNFKNTQVLEQSAFKQLSRNSTFFFNKNTHGK